MNPKLCITSHLGHYLFILAYTHTKSEINMSNWETDYFLRIYIKAELGVYSKELL